MKKLLFYLLLLFYASNSFAEDGYAEHTLIVHRLSYWAPDFLTVTNNWNNMCFTNAPSTLRSLSVITEINGQSTKGMEPTDFYSIIDRNMNFTITYKTKINGENKLFTHNLIRKSGKLLYYNPVYEYYHAGIARPNENQTRIDKTTLLSNQNVDLFEFCTFDYLVAGDDYATDRLLLQDFSKYLEKKGMKYTPSEPDVYLYLTKDINSSIESIYVPNIISTTTSTSSSRGGIHFYYGSYNGWGHGSSTTNSSSTTRIRDIGETKSLVDANIYIQFSMLDAKNMKGQKPPVLWQLTHNNHYIKEVNLLDEAKKIKEEVICYPFTIKKVGREIMSLGVLFDNYTSISGVVSDVADNSWAEKNGIKFGNILKMVSGKGYGDSFKYKPGKGKPFPYGALNHFDDIEFDNVKIKGMQYYGRREELHIPYFYVPEEELEE